MKTSKTDAGEFGLLGFFALFIIIFIVDIHDLPFEAKILTYVLAPLIMVLLALCAIKTAKTLKAGKETQTKGDRKPAAADPEQARIQTLRLIKTIGMSIFLLLSIYFFGFYWGSGIMLLVWFLVFQKLNRLTIIITLVTPVILYAIFELLIEFGLHEGVLITYLFD